jgi:transcription initiation factor TFIIB
MFELIKIFDDNNSINDILIEKNTLECIECKSINNQLYTKGKIICLDCGTILEDSVTDMTAEWRNFGFDDHRQNDPTRCSMPINNLLFESSIGTYMKLSSKQYNQTNYSLKNSKKWYCISSKERSLKKQLDTINNNCSVNSIPNSIIENAMVLCKNVTDIYSSFKNEPSRKGNRMGLRAACVYYSCKTFDVKRSHKEIANIFNIKSCDVTKGCKLFFKIMETHNLNSDIKTNQTITYLDFIDRFCNKLNVETIMKNKVKQIAEKVKKLNISDGSSPDAIVASCIALISMLYELNICRKSIAKECNISYVTLSKTYKNLLNSIEYLI